MSNKNHLLLLFLSCSLYLNAINDTISNGEINIQNLDSLSILSVLNEERKPTNAITKAEVAEFFKSGVSVTDLEVIESFEGNKNQYLSFNGYLKLGSDTVPYYINTSGIGILDFYKSFGVVNNMAFFYKNEKIIKPTVTNTVPQSYIYILGYSKENFDFTDWKNHPDYNNKGLFQAYKRWNKLKTKNIYQIFNYCKREDEFYMFSYDYSVSFYGLEGFLIFENKIYNFMLNAGGVFYFRQVNQIEPSTDFYYVCWDKRGLKYLVDYVYKDPINY